FASSASVELAAGDTSSRQYTLCRTPGQILLRHLLVRSGAPVHRVVLAEASLGLRAVRRHRREGVPRPRRGLARLAREARSDDDERTYDRPVRAVGAVNPAPSRGKVHTGLLVDLAVVPVDAAALAEAPPRLIGRVAAADRREGESEALRREAAGREGDARPDDRGGLLVGGLIMP
ncbi:hypothetical protein THAOC_11052, partial [Thalassiosira oceanica]